MAYKFSIGTYRHSGSMVAEEGITVDSGGLTVTGSVSLPAGEIGNAELANSEITINGYATALGASVTLDTADLASFSGSVEDAVDAHVTVADGLAYSAGAFSLDDGGIANAKLENSAITINGYSTALGGTVTLDTADLASFSGSVHDALSAGDGLTYDAAAGQFAVTSSIAGDGLAWNAGVLSVDASELISDLDSVIDEHLSGSGFITYVSGVIGVDASAFTADVRDEVSAANGAASDSGSLAYDSGTGVFTLSPASPTWAKGLFSAVDAGGDGSFSYSDGVFTYTGPSAAEARAHFSAGDTNSIDMTYISGTGQFEAVLKLSGSSLEVTSDGVRIASAAAGAGLGWSNSVLDVLTTGAMAVKNDKVAISASVAGAGLAFVADGFGAVSQLSVAPLGVTNAMLSGAIENAKLVNSSVTVTGGDGLSAGGVVALGSSVTLDVQVDSAALEINGSDQVALKSTISGSRTFQNNVTIEGDLIVTGTTFSASVGTLLVEDAKITIADGALALSASQGFEIGNNLASFVVGDGSSSNSAFVSSLELKASKFIGAVEGTLADSLQTLSANGAVTASVVLCDAGSAGFTATLPTAAGKSGQMYKVKKSEGSANGVTVAADGSETIDGVASIVLESPYAAVMLVSDGSNWFVF